MGVAPTPPLACAAVADAATTENRPAGSTAPLAWVVTLTIAAGLALVVIVASFSQNNTPASIDGDTATTSHYVDGDQ